MERAAGVEPLEPDWARFRVAPALTEVLPGARITLHTVRGRVDVAWQSWGSALALDLRVPVNAVAEALLPGGERREVGSGAHRWDA